MNLEALVKGARARGASDLHIEAGQPVVVRVRGELQKLAEAHSAAETREAAMALLGEQNWAHLVEQRSFDFSRALGGVRCRVNIFCTSRGIGFALRLLAQTTPTLETLNLLPDLRDFVSNKHGLILVSGSTGSGKSSTLAALIQEINLTERRHIITVEEPIEYTLRSQRAFIRQREVGTHTPSFEQALIDALREDPDVMMVGEMRHPEVMRLTLSFAETGHLVFATVHSSNAMEALQRIALSFPPEAQSVVCAQLADSLIAVIAQRLVYRPDLRVRVPECEILAGSPGVRNLIRQGQFFKLESAVATGAKDGMYSWERYQQWMQSRTRWHVPGPADREAAEEPVEAAAESPFAAGPAASFTAAPRRQPSAPATVEEDVITLEPAHEKLAEFVSRLKPLGS